MANWEKKSAYLLREIVKFQTYKESLSTAAQQKEVVMQEREMRAAEKAARSQSLGGDSQDVPSVEVDASADVDTDVPPMPPPKSAPAALNLNLGVPGDVPPPLSSPTTNRMLDAMPMPPGTSQSA